MERFLNWLERRVGSHVPAGLPFWLVGLWGATFLLLYAKPDLYPDFILLADGLKNGEVWRLATFLLLPPYLGRGLIDLLLAFFVLQLAYMVLSALEGEWGALRLWVYLLIGALGAVAAAFLTGYADNKYLYLSLLLAFGTVFPDFQLNLMLFLPVKMKWLAMLDGAWLLYAFATGSATSRAAIAMAVLNYLLFFAPTLLDLARGKARALSGGGSRKRASFSDLTSRPVRKVRVCARCGKSEADDPRLEFRVCDCEKCGGKATDYCIEHARAH